MFLDPFLPDLQIPLFWQSIPRPVCVGSKCLGMLPSILRKLGIQFLQRAHIACQSIVDRQSIPEVTQDLFDRIRTVFFY